MGLLQCSQMYCNNGILLYLLADEAEALFAERFPSDTSENTSSITNEILVAMGQYKGVFTICATNFPQKLDNAFIRRLQKRILIGMPESIERKLLLKKSLKKRHHCLHEFDLDTIANDLDGYSAFDISTVIREAQNLACKNTLLIQYFKKLSTLHQVMVPCSEAEPNAVKVTCDELEERGQCYIPLKITVCHVVDAMTVQKSTVDKKMYSDLMEFHKKFGC